MSYPVTERISDGIYNITFPIRALICRIRGHRPGSTYPVVENGTFDNYGNYVTGPEVGSLSFCRVCSHVESDVDD